MKHPMPIVSIPTLIHVIRGHKVMLDRDLARLYGVETFNLNKAVKRNIDRFPRDFMFRLTQDEYDSLRFQIGILKRGQHAKYLPLAFTQEGVAMLSSVLKSERASRVNVAIMRVFVKLREMSISNDELSRKLHLLEQRMEKHASKFRKQNREIRTIFNAIYELMKPRRTSIGFKAT